jgi:hypothetical protein
MYDFKKLFNVVVENNNNADEKTIFLSRLLNLDLLYGLNLTAKNKLIDVFIKTSKRSKYFGDIKAIPNNAVIDTKVYILIKIIYVFFIKSSFFIIY